MTQHPGLLDIPAAPAEGRPAGAGTTWEDFEIIEIQRPYDPRITKVVGAPKGSHREPLVAIRRRPSA
jgi:hypothetical protein